MCEVRRSEQRRNHRRDTGNICDVVLACRQPSRFAPDRTAVIKTQRVISSRATAMSLTAHNVLAVCAQVPERGLAASKRRASVARRVTVTVTHRNASTTASGTFFRLVCRTLIRSFNNARQTDAAETHACTAVRPYRPLLICFACATRP